MKKTLLLLACMLSILFLEAQNYSRDFNGSSSNVHSDNAPALFADIENNDFTVELWARIDDLEAYGTNTRLFEIINHPADDYRFVQISIPSTGYIQAGVEVSSTTEYTESTNDQLKVGIWYHIALTWDASETEVGLYVNGVEQSGGNLSTFTAGTGSNNIYLGCRSDGTGHLDGALDEFRIWNDIRTQAEIRQYMYQSAPTSDAGLEVYYKMDETSGTVVDNAEGTTSYDATAVNTSTYPSSAWYDTKYGLYFSGAGDGDYVSCPAGNKHNSTDVITIESMVYLSAIVGGGDYPRILYRPKSSGAGVGLGDAAYALAFDGDYDPKPRFAINGHYIQPGTFDISPTYWYHIAGTYDKNAASDQMKLYVDGILVATGTCTDDIPTSTCNLCDLALGAGYDGSSTFDYFLKGYIDEVRVWESCRTAEQIRENMYLSLTGGETDLKMYWKFDQPGGTTVPDAAYVGTPVDGTQSGCTWGRCKSFYTWLDTEDDNWTSTTNWSIGDLPSDKRCISIYNFGDNTMPVLGASNIRNLVVGTGANFALSVDDELTIGINLHNFGTMTINSGGSLITRGTITSNGTINVKQSLAEDGHWHFISAPNNNTDAGDLFDEMYLQQWIEGDGPEAGWQDITNPETELTPAKGFSLWMDDGAKMDFTYTGTPNTGDQSIAITSNGTGTNKWMNFVGNPYPSYLDWDYIEGYGSKYTWTGTDYDERTEAGAGAGSRYVNPMEGFFIYKGAGVSNNFNLDNSKRCHGSLGKKENEGITLEFGIILNATGKKHTDEFWIIFNEMADVHFDQKYDAWKIISVNDGVSQLYSICPDGNLAVDVRPQTESIQLGFTNNEAGTYSIDIKEIADISTALLEDSKLNIFHDLTQGAYTFDWSLNDDETRFKLHLNTTAVEEISGNAVQAYVAGGNIIVQSESPAGRITLTDIAGRTLGVWDNVENIPAPSSTGVYLVTLEADHKRITKKIIVE